MMSLPSRNIRSFKRWRGSIVILDSPDIYSEYAPYTYIEDMKEFIDKVTQLNRVA